MIIGLGLDICEISRMEKYIQDDRFLTRYFTPEEIRYVRSKGAVAAQTLAGLFASREALGKALGKGIDFELNEAEIRHDINGCPYYCFSGCLAERVTGDRFFLSVTHDGGIAAAVCVRERDRDSL